jgi:chitin synthase
MVWYQKFEYAIGHWLQKAAEHILGCVMCSPGCFSLFRGSALMDDHVLRTYALKSSEARHYVQYDQGEDRWLCTLLLQEGYRVEYCAASDALTYAPESFHVCLFFLIPTSVACLPIKTFLFEGILQSKTPLGSINNC